jgi:xanthine dehydrogenase YagR molybdenum-binding subunit
MANSWPKQPRLLGKKFRRLDGPEKSTGRAKYSYDINPKGLLHAQFLRCPHAHARVTKLDTSDAEKMPGVKAIHVVAGEGKELFYAGDEILAIAADTEEHVLDALRAVKIKYEELPFFVKEEDVLKNPTAATVRPVGGNRKNLRPGGENTKQENDKEGAIDAAFKDAHAVVEGDYGVPVICHQCLEPHGLVAQWDEDGNNLTVWCSTQAVPGTATDLAMYFKVPSSQVRCITHYMGGGYGSKFGADIQGKVAAALARKAKAPVKLMLDRESEITTAGNRPSAFGKIKMAATKDGKITAYEFEGYGTAGVSNAPGVNIGQLPYVYGEAIPNVRSRNQICGTNAGEQRAMRAPGHPQMCTLTEWPLDDLAAKLGMDPLQMRLKNLPANDPDAVQNEPQSYNALRHTIYTEEIKKAAELAEWDKKWHPPGEGKEKGPIKHGIGMAIHTWGGAGGAPNDMIVSIASDGSVLLESSTQDLGTGERTVLAIVVAEILGLEPHDVTIRIGESQFGRSTGSGGSTTTPGTSPAALNAAVAARNALFKAIAPRLNAKADELAIEPGRIVNRGNNRGNGSGWSWKEACARLGMDKVKETGNWTEGLSGNGVGGVQMAEVAVDTETGVVRCKKVVAVQDCGRIINEQGCISQVSGGVIMAVNAALLEERIMDRHTGRQVNPNMEFYKIGGIKDMPEIIVHMHHMPDRGVIGIGEPPTISTCAAIGNAVHNAIGVRVPFAPFSPERVLAALSKKGGKA